MFDVAEVQRFFGKRVSFSYKEYSPNISVFFFMDNIPTSTKEAFIIREAKDI